MKNQYTYRFIFYGLFLFLGWIAAYQNVLAQAQPVQATLQLSPPYSVYLPDYGIPGSEQMRLQLLLRDIAEPEYPVRLHLVVEGSGIRIETNPAYHPQPIYLQGGIPTMVSGEVLGPYLESSHLLFSGISRQNYEQKGSLPEGMYTFSVRVLDYRRTDVVLSNEAVFTAWLMLNDPPRINTPICGSELPLNDLQSVLFQWMPGSAGSPNAAFDTEYEFTLVEVHPQGRNPEDAIRSTMPLFQQTTDFTSIAYGISEPPLIPGQQYAFRVKARDKQGRDLFKNQGYSPVCTFTYGDIDPLEPPEGINVYAEAERRARISWEMSINPDSYRVEYRKQPKEGESFSWFKTETTQDELTLYDLEPETNYEVRVASLFQGFASRYTQTHTFTTPTLRIAACGERPDIRSYEDVAPLPTAIAGQYWQVGNFEMQLLEVRGGDGTFSGLGSITVPYLGLQVPVKFDHVQVNQNRELFRGEVHALSEEIDSFRKRWTEENPLQENTDEPSPQQEEISASTEEAIPLAPETLSVEGTITKVIVNTAGQIVINREGGSSQTYTQPQDEETGEKQTTTILDSQGNSYVVDKEGGVKQNENSKEANSLSANALLIEVLDEFEEAMQAWLRVHGKGPLSQAEMQILQDLPQGIPADEDLVGPLVDYILPEIRQNHEPFLQAIEQHNPQAVRLIRNVNALDELTAEEQAEIKLSIAEQLVQNGLAYIIKEFLYELGLNGACLDQGIQKGKSVYWEKLKAGFSIGEVVALAFNAGTTETLFCLTSRENCPGQEYWGQFGCGAVHALVEEIDLNGMVDGLLALRKAYFKNRISCLTEGSSFIMVGPSDEEESLRLMLSCALGIDISIAEIQKVYPSIKQYVSEQWDDPYTHGQATIFLLSIVSPTKLTKAAKLKLIHKLKGNKLFATKLDDLKALSEAVEEGKDLGKVVDELGGGVNLAAYANVRKYLGNSRVKQYLLNQELFDLETLIKRAHPDVLKHIDEMDEFDFAEMARGYRDLKNNGKLSTFENAIKQGDNFYGQYGWLTYWKLTPGMKYSLTTIEDLRKTNSLLPIGNATEIQLASLQAFTRSGDFINVPMRYNPTFMGEYAQKGLKHIEDCLKELKKVPARQVRDEVYSGKTFSKAEFERKFVGSAGKTHNFPSFISTSRQQSVAEGFIDLTGKWAGDGEKVAVIQRIISKEGVYIDDLSDWGEHLGKIRHADQPPAIQRQYEVLLNPGNLKQIGEPIPIMENGLHKTIDGMKAYYVDFTQ